MISIAWHDSFPSIHVRSEAGGRFQISHFLPSRKLRTGGERGHN